MGQRFKPIPNLIIMEIIFSVLLPLFRLVCMHVFLYTIIAFNMCIITHVGTTNVKVRNVHIEVKCDSLINRLYTICLMCLLKRTVSIFLTWEYLGEIKTLQVLLN